MDSQNTSEPELQGNNLGEVINSIDTGLPDLSAFNQGKESWPELEGVNVDEAVNLITTENAQLKVFKVEEGSPVTRDYHLDRVRIYFNPETQLVVGIPRCG